MGSLRWIDRDEWGQDITLQRCGHLVPHTQFVQLFVHHTVIVQRDWDGDGYLNGDLDDIYAYMRSLQTARPDLGLDVPYSFVVFPGAEAGDGIVCEGRGWARTGAHTIDHNSTSYGVAFAGDMTDWPPTPGMLAAVRWVGEGLADPYNALPTKGHRDVYATACPGAMAYPLLDLVQPPFTTAPPPEDDDMTPAEYKQATVEMLGDRATLENGVIYLALLETWNPATGEATYKKYPWGTADIFIHQELKMDRIRKEPPAPAGGLDE